MSDIQNPKLKASAAMVSGFGSSVLAKSVEAHSFFPATFAEWSAAIASLVAATYTICLLLEWIFKKVKGGKRDNP